MPSAVWQVVIVIAACAIAATSVVVLVAIPVYLAACIYMYFVERKYAAKGINIYLQDSTASSIDSEE